MSFAPMKEELSRTLPTKGFTNMVDTNQERFPEANMRLSESATPPNNSRSHQSSGNTTNTTTVSKNSTAMERKSSERPSTRDRRDRADQSNMSLDSSLTMMDETVNSSILNRSSLLEALKQEKESRPESYWRV